MKKLLLLLLALTLSLTLLTACNNNDTPPIDTDTEEEETEKELTTADILGFDKKNYGEEFLILLNDGAAITKADFFAEEDASDRVSIATYDRNLACEEYLGISLQYVPKNGVWNSGITNEIYTLVSTGACDYDMAAIALNAGIMGGHISIFQNIMQMDYIEPTHSWWVQDMIDQVAINNQLYFLTGDTCVTTYAYIGCIFANLDVAENFNLGVDFYETVKSGNWTMEEFYRLFKLVGEDTDNNGSFDPATETYGWSNNNISVRLMWSCCNMNLIERQEDGTFALIPSLDDRLITFISQLKTELSDPHQSLVPASADMVKAFVADRVLFAADLLSAAGSLKAANIESDYAILPMPKLDTNQADYISTNMPAYNALFFPVTVENPDMSAQVAEYMGWYGQENIIPEYYDQTLKLRQNDSEANIEMIDLIREKLRVTPNELYGIIGETGSDTVMYMLQTISSNLSTDGFYSNPVSVWKTRYTTFADRINSYVFKYYQ